MPLDVSGIWKWPDTLVVILLTVVIAIVAKLLVNAAIKGFVAAALKRAEAHREQQAPGRAQRLWAEATGVASERAKQRAQTVGSLLRSIATFVIVLIALLTILSAVGLPLAPLLASAGVGGLAIGFGAQSLVKDCISGIFMIIEDQYGVGDYIDAGEVSGTVEEVTLRVTRLRDPSGQVWYVRNGAITRIGNLSQGWSLAMVDVPVAYDTDAAAAIAVLEQVAADVDADEQWHGVLLDRPRVLGVDSLSAGAMVLRIMIKCAPNQQWGVQRDLRERAKAALAAAGVRGPQAYPAGP